MVVDHCFRGWILMKKKKKKTLNTNLQTAQVLEFYQENGDPDKRGF